MRGTMRTGADVTEFDAAGPYGKLGERGREGKE